MKGTVHLDHADILDAIAKFVGSIGGASVGAADVRLEVAIPEVSAHQPLHLPAGPTLAATVSAERRR